MCLGDLASEKKEVRDRDGVYQDALRPDGQNSGHNNNSNNNNNNSSNGSSSINNNNNNNNNNWVGVSLHSSSDEYQMFTEALYDSDFDSMITRESNSHTRSDMRQMFRCAFNSGNHNLIRTFVNNVVNHGTCLPCLDAINLITQQFVQYEADQGILTCMMSTLTARARDIDMSVITYWLGNIEHAWGQLNSYDNPDIDDVLDRESEKYSQILGQVSTFIHELICGVLSLSPPKLTYADVHTLISHLTDPGIPTPEIISLIHDLSSIAAESFFEHGEHAAEKQANKSLGVTYGLGHSLLGIFSFSRTHNTPSLAEQCLQHWAGHSADDICTCLLALDGPWNKVETYNSGGRVHSGIIKPLAHHHIDTLARKLTELGTGRMQQEIAADKIPRLAKMLIPLCAHIPSVCSVSEYALTRGLSDSVHQTRIQGLATDVFSTLTESELRVAYACTPGVRSLAEQYVRICKHPDPTPIPIPTTTAQASTCHVQYAGLPLEVQNFLRGRETFLSLACADSAEAKRMIKTDALYTCGHGAARLLCECHD